jgi:hypothetical protein
MDRGALRMNELDDRMAEPVREIASPATDPFLDGLLERFRKDVRLLAKRLHTRIDELHWEDRHYMDDQFQKTRTLIQLCYSDLDERVTRLEQRNP